MNHNFKMSKALKVLILVLIIGGMVSFGLPKIFQSSAQETKPLEVEKVLPKIADKDKNKIFDNLETLLAGQPESATFDTIVLFNQALFDGLIAQARQTIGNFPIKFQYPSISGIAATLTKGQIKINRGQLYFWWTNCSREQEVFVII